MIGGKKFAYLKNLSGDILGVVNWEGVQLVRYSYDAWGKPYAENLIASGDYLSVAEDVIEKNPYLYRGYRYDRDAGLYYLNSRYYDPETGRFINADDYVSTGQGILGSNMYAYCGNNPVRRSDSGGHSEVDVYGKGKGDVGAVAVIGVGGFAFGAIGWLNILYSLGKKVLPKTAALPKATTKEERQSENRNCVYALVEENQGIETVQYIRKNLLSEKKGSAASAQSGKGKSEDEGPAKRPE